MQKWNLTLKRVIKKIKRDPSDDYDTEYIDVDQLLGMYIDIFKQQKIEGQKKLARQFVRVTGSNEQRAECTFDNMQSIMEGIQNRS